MDIFRDNAPSYYYRKLPVIPLYRADTRPLPANWAIYHNAMPAESLRNQWLEECVSNNIGLVLGEQSGLCALQITAKSPVLRTLIADMMPFSPWRRVSNEEDGPEIWLYRYNPRITNFEIMDTEGTSYCRFLSARSLLVLPPSVDNLSGEPYVANMPFVEAMEEVQPIDDDTEAVLRGVIDEYLTETDGSGLSHTGWSQVTDYMAPGTRDVSLSQTTGNLSWAVIRGERTFVEAVDMVRSTALSFDDRVAGPPVDVDRHLRDLVNFLHRDIHEKNRVLPLGWDDGLTPELTAELGADFGQEHQGWSFEKTRQWLYDQIRQFPDQEGERLRVVDEALQRMARSNSLTTLEQDRIFRFIQDSADVDIRITTLRRRLRELTGGSVEGNDQTEVAEAAIADLKRMYIVRFHDECFWYWGGSHWTELDKQVIMQRLSDAYGHLPICKRWSDMWSILKIMAFKLQQGLVDLSVEGVNFANGFLTKDLKLLEHRPEYGMTYTLPLRYLPEAEGDAKMFFEFLHSVWGHNPDYREKVDALQEAMAVTLFGVGTTFQRAILLQGLARSGKTQLLRIVSCLVPDNARCVVPPTEWGARFTPTAMYSKLLNIAGELHEYKAISGQVFKAVVDGTEMFGERKGKDGFTFHPKCTHWFASNHYPRTGDTSEGFNRRWLVLEFDKQVSPAEMKRNIGDRIVAEEREAIIAWVVQGMVRLMKNRDFTLPASHKRVMSEIANLNNSVRFFVVESPEVIVGPVTQEDGSQILTHISEGELFREYSVFCTQIANAKPVGARGFRAKMKELAAELGFTAEVTQIAGISTYQYTNITLARRVQVSGKPLTMEQLHPSIESLEGSNSVN